MYDFDRIIDRSGTGALKYELYAGRGIIPMWVADMDFSAPPEIIDAVQNRASHGIYGYTIPQKQLKDLIVQRMAELYNWQIEPGWILFTAGLVSGLNCICRAICRPGQQVTVFTPIYPPFLEIPEANYCEIVRIPMVNSHEYYTIDFDGFSNSLGPGSGMLMLSNPHNPTGRVHSRAELEQLADICLKHGLPIVSDEIHCELLLGESRHIPIATLGEDVQRQTITLMSASKTFNIPGLMCGFAIISEAELREKVRAMVNKLASHPNLFGYETTYAAYRYGEPWRMELLKYLTANRDLVNARLGAVKQLGVCSPEATYLSWIDCRGLGDDDPVRLFERHGIGLSNGSAFDAPGYVRLNFACPRSVLEQALDIMVSVASRA